ncbi:riboflavin kinase, partial [Butyricicoccus sp.]
LYRKLRGEIKFPSLEALQAEIRRNAAETRAYFAEHET